MPAPPDPRSQRPGVSQIGEITSGNLATWDSPGRLQDGGPPGSGRDATKVIADTAYDLLPTDNKPAMLVLSAGAPTVVTINAGVVKADFTQLIVDYVGGGSVAVGIGVTLLAPNGSATTSAGEEITIACPFDDVVVLGGSTS